MTMLYCDHDKTTFIVMLLAKYAMIISFGLYRFNHILHVTTAELLSKLIKDSLHKCGRLRLTLLEKLDLEVVRQAE